MLIASLPRPQAQSLRSRSIGQSGQHDFKVCAYFEDVRNISIPNTAHGPPTVHQSPQAVWSSQLAHLRLHSAAGTLQRGRGKWLAPCPGSPQFNSAARLSCRGKLKPFITMAPNSARPCPLGWYQTFKMTTRPKRLDTPGVDKQH